MPYIFDGHNDLAWAVRELCGYDLDAIDLANGTERLQTDLPRLRRGGGCPVLVGVRAVLTHRGLGCLGDAGAG